MDYKSFTANDILERAILEIPNIPEETTFIMKDLFPNYIWSNFEISQRKIAGAMFANYLQKQNNIGVVAIDKKTPQGQQIYKKV